MQFTTLLAIASAPLLALAAENPFRIPPSGLAAKGEQPLELEWEPTTDGTVTLILRSGDSDELSQGTILASEIDNSGHYTWTPSNDLTRGADYTVEIVVDHDPDLINFTPYFRLDTPTTEVQSTSTVTLGAPSTMAPVMATVAASGSSGAMPMVTSDAAEGSDDAASMAAEGAASKASMAGPGLFALVALGAAIF